MKRPAKPSSSQLLVLRNLAAGRKADAGIPHTRSHAAGFGCTFSSLIRRGWAGYREGRPYLTEAGEIEAARK